MPSSALLPWKLGVNDIDEEEADAAYQLHVTTHMTICHVSCHFPKRK